MFLNVSRYLLLAAAMVALLALGGCARKYEANRVVRLAVLDGVTAYDVATKGEAVVDGWWFGTRTRFRSPNVGIQLGEAFSTEFQKLPGVEVYSRDDMTIYLAQKERLISRNYGDLNEFQRKILLLSQEPVDFGKSLNVDYVLRSVVIDGKTIVNQSLPWWYSRLSLTMELVDVSTGEVVFADTWQDSDNFDSQLALVEEAAREISRRAKKRDAFSLYGNR
jgi:hypothetical protein